MNLAKTFKLDGVAYNDTSLRVLAEEYSNLEDQFKQEIGHFLLQWFDESDTVTVQTSGSTGTPKKIELAKVHMINSALATGTYFNQGAGTTALLCLSANYIAGKMMLVRAMVLGWDLILRNPKANPLDQVDQQIDFAAMVPLQVEASLEHINKINHLIIGGAPVSAALQQELEKVKTKCYATYGMTETITHIAVKKLNHCDEKTQYFEVLPNIEISQDNRECLIINAPKVSNEFVVTNDIVMIHDNNSFEWLGRYDNVINSGGVKLFPEQIERKLNEIIKERFFVYGLPDETLGQKLVLVIETINREIDLNKNLYLEAGLTRYEIPKQVIHIDEFKETPTGKIQRNLTLHSYL